MNIAIIKQSGGKYLFEVPESITLKEGEKVKCDTRRGVTDGIVWANSITADEPAAKLIGKLLGAKFPLKSVVGKSVTSVEMFEQPKQEPVKLYCVEDCSGFTTKGKVYEFTDGDIRLDDGCFKAEVFTDYADFVSYNRDIALCLVPLVPRSAKVGEWVYVNHAVCGSGKSYKNGDIFEVTGTNAFGKSDVFVKGVESSFIYRAEYLVLDGYKPEPEKAESEYYSGKVVCVDDGGCGCCWVVGAPYKVINGEIRDKDGCLMLDDVTSLDDLNSRLNGKFIEFKGE